MRTRIHILVLLTTCLAFPIAWADEGVLEINQSCAENNGCFAGDDPGLPVEISNSGSYVLTSNVTLPASETGIAVLAQDVTIDLNGFEISGQGSCTGRPVSSCTGATSEAAILAQGYDNLAVLDGTIRGIEGDGIVSGTGVRMKGISIEGVTRNGIDVARDAVLVEVQSLLNGNVGINAERNTVIRDSNVEGNGSSGITTGFRLNVSGSVVSDNGASGIVLSTGSIVRNVTVGQNSGDGIQALGTGNLVVESSFVNNDDFAINCLAEYTVITDSIMRINNAAGDQFTTPNCQAVGENFCNSNTTCP